MAVNPNLVIKVSGNTKEFDSAMSGLPNTVERKLSPLKIAAAGAAASFTLLALETKKAIDEFRNFERDFSNVVTLLDSSSFKTKSFEEGVAGLRSELINLRASSGQSFDTLNKGLFDLVSAGVDAEKSIKALAVSTDLALAGGTDTSIAVDGLTTALNSFNIEAENSRQVAEKFFTAQKYGKTTIEELSSGLGQVSATAAGMGVSFDEVLASVSAATLAGIRTREAYTGLKAAFSNIIKPSKDAADEAERLGINFDSMSLKSKGLKGFLDSITQSANFNSTSLEKLFGSMEAVNIVLALTGSQAGSFNDILTELKDEEKSAGTFADALAEKHTTLDDKMNRLKGSAESLRVAIGEKLSPTFGKFADDAADSLDYVREHLDDLEAAITGTANRLTTLSMTIAQNLANVMDVDFTPSLTNVDPFEGLIESAKKYSLDHGQTINEIIANEERLAKLRADRIEEDKRAVAEELARAKKKADEEERLAQEKEEKEAERRQAKLEREAEQFDEDIETLTERLNSTHELEAQFEGLKELLYIQDLQKKQKTEQQKQKLDAATAKAGIAYTNAQKMATLNNLAEIFDTSTAVGKALFLIQKALAIANIIKDTQEAAMLAYASQLIPGDPTSLARAQAAKMWTQVQGGIAAAAVAATAIQGAAEGGIVQGGVFGKDTQPFLLAKDEIVVPSKLNPLSPNFDDTFGGTSFGGQTVNVQISLDDRASEILTAKQVEDRTLGVSR